MNRHELREQVFRLLFRVEFNSMEDMPEQVKLFIGNEEVFESDNDKVFVSDRYNMIKDHIPEIDTKINDNTEGWTTDRMGKVELTVLRLALYEMLYDDAVPERVAINEAVEIAKLYGQANSGAFVNAILGKFVKTGD